MQLKIFLRNSLSPPPPTKLFPRLPQQHNPPTPKLLTSQANTFLEFLSPPQNGGGACYELIQSQQ